MKKNTFRPFMFVRLLHESLLFAYSSIISNKLRTFLSLLGVTIGIFSLIAMATIVEALENNVNNSLSAMGSKTLYIQRFPWMPEADGVYRWWKFAARPTNEYSEYTYLRDHSQLAEAVSMFMGFSREARYKNNNFSPYIIGVTHEWAEVDQKLNVEQGRYFSNIESQTGKNVIILGATVKEKLFGDEDAVGKQMKVGGYKCLIIGVLKKEGESMININNYDESIMMPLHYAKLYVNIRWANPTIAIKGKETSDINDLTEETRILLRNLRRIKPVAEDNFSINQLSVLKQMTDQIFGVIHMVGFFIGLLSLIVGGFGIANIMFVSVKERTNIIGIQKALGAKRYFILVQFLAEAVVLSLAGGLIGLLLIFALSALVNSLSDFTLSLSVGNIMMGLMVSTVIGVASGFIPALIGALMDPVKAISKQ